MALSDLLWACPRCGTDRGLDPEGVCQSCGTRYSRGAGAEIVAATPDGSDVVRSAADWADRLPDPATLLVEQEDTPVRRAGVSIRRVQAEERVSDASGYLNRIEIFGEPRDGSLTLFRNHIVVQEEGEGEPEEWPLEELTAVQASSSTLQLKRQRTPLVSFRFHDDSVFLWESLLHAALRDFYGRTGRGKILEFQPRIACR